MAKLISKKDFFSVYPYKFTYGNAVLNKSEIRHYLTGYSNTQEIIEELRKDIIADYVIVKNDDRDWITCYAYNKGVQGFIKCKRITEIETPKVW